MKTKLQALIAEQKALTTKIEELVNETNYAFIGNDEYSKEIKTFFGGEALVLSDTYFADETSIYFTTKMGYVGKCDCSDYVVESLALSHTIIDLNEQPDFFEELSNSDKPNNPDPHKIYIKGHPTRGAEVIKMLEDLGGVNKHLFKGHHIDFGYYITNKGFINNAHLSCLYDYTELHLPEENAQIADIQVGDWIWVDEIYDYADDVTDLIKKANPHKIIEGEEVGYLDFEIDGHDYQISTMYDKFHKVDPPTEEVELIEGEMYWARDFVFIYSGQNDDGSCRYLCGVNTYCDSIESELNNNGSFIDKEHNELATHEQRKQLFDALEKASKYFDKENMRLLDVEGWSKEHRDYPVICRSDNSTSWSVKLMCEYVKGRALVKTKSSQNQWMSQAVPYNDQTKLLIGTTDNPDKHYVFVESK